MTDLVDFTNRLEKNRRKLRSWLSRDDVHAYRLYDCDIPEFPLTLDVFETEEGLWIHLQEVDTGWKQTEQAHREWLSYVIEAVAEALAVAPARIALKTRARQRTGGDKTVQYGRTGRHGRRLVVKEGRARLLVDLETYVDTGLFLDHRPMRDFVGRHAAGRRLLNLFSYTGSFTVQAAVNGAAGSVSVDLSNTYCDWAADNLALNGVNEATHRIVRDDVLQWLKAATAAPDRFDLVVLDPPTFSNSKKMDGILDVQRDHSRLIHQAASLLTPDGLLIFSTNLRSFRMDASLGEALELEDVTERSIPADFRDRKIHQCWIIRHRQRA